MPCFGLGRIDTPRSARRPAVGRTPGMWYPTSQFDDAELRVELKSPERTGRLCERFGCDLVASHTAIVTGCHTADGAAYVTLAGGNCDAICQVLRILDCRLGLFVAVKCTRCGAFGLYHVLAGDTLRRVDAADLPEVLRWMRHDMELTAWHHAEAVEVFGGMR